MPSSSQVFPLVTDRRQVSRVSGSDVRRRTPRAPAWRNLSASDSLIPLPQMTAAAFEPEGLPPDISSDEANRCSQSVIAGVPNDLSITMAEGFRSEEHTS